MDALIRLLPGYSLVPEHPLYPREAYQCDVCSGIFYPPGPPTTCPYCEDKDDQS